jgi:hypothetical protein
VPSEDYAAELGKPNSKGRYRFGASMKENTKDQWRKYRLEASALPSAILKRLDALASAA